MTRKLPLIPTILVAAGGGDDDRPRHLAARAAQRRSRRCSTNYAAAASACRRSAGRPCRRKEPLPLVPRRRPAIACRSPASARAAGQNRDGEPASWSSPTAATGAEGPGMAVELGWSKNPNAGRAYQRRAGQRRDRARQHEPDAAGRGTRRAGADGQRAAIAGDPIPNNHLSYAIQWFLFARDRGGDLRPRAAPARGGRRRPMAELTRLANGVTVAIDPMPGAQSAAIGLHAFVGSRSEADGKGGLAHLVEHMVFKGARGRDARAIAEAIEDVGGSLNAWTSRDQTAVPRAHPGARRRPGAGADRRPGPCAEARRGRAGAGEAGHPVGARRMPRCARRPDPRPSVRGGVRRAAAGAAGAGQ